MQQSRGEKMAVCTKVGLCVLRGHVEYPCPIYLPIIMEMQSDILTALELPLEEIHLNLGLRRGCLSSSLNWAYVMRENRRI